MLDEFYQRFGEVVLGPADHPDYGRALYDRSSGARRYALDAESWAIDTQTRERAFRLGADSRVFLPSGQEIARPGPLPPTAHDTIQRLYGSPNPAGRVERKAAHQGKARGTTTELAQRMFGRGR